MIRNRPIQSETERDSCSNRALGLLEVEALSFSFYSSYIFSVMANSDSDCGWSSAQKPKHCRKKRKAKLMAIVDDGIGLKPKDGKKPEAGAAKVTCPCSECGKKFWSWKALFGHMRCHPEREWRGINPPPNLRRQNDMTEEEHEVADCLMLLASGIHEKEEAGPSGSNTRFECSSCNRVFGHRESHKNVKGCFGITRSGGDWEENIHEDDDDEMVSGLGGHKCSICQRVFSSGQALGGHKRCHWEKGNNDPSSISTPPKPACGCGVDLNLPPPLPLPLPLQHHSPLTLDLRLGL